jgi:hypothetical protein
MTYPPQQPGPYGPDPYGQQPPGYGQQPPWAGPGAYPVGPPPRKSRSGPIVTLIIVGILVLGGGGVGLYFLTRDDNGPGGDGPPPGGDPQAVAERAIDIIERTINSDLEDFDAEGLKPLMCAEDFERAAAERENTLDKRQSSGRRPSRLPAGEQVELTVSDVRVDGDRGTFTVTEKQGDDRPRDRELDLVRTNGAWQVCGFSDSAPAPGPRPTAASTTGKLPPFPTPTRPSR